MEASKAIYACQYLTYKNIFVKFVLKVRHDKNKNIQNFMRLTEVVTILIIICFKKKVL